MAPYVIAGLITLGMMANAIGEAWAVVHALDGMSRNPELAGKLRTSMILGCSLIETTAIYTLLIAILILFVAR